MDAGGGVQRSARIKAYLRRRLDVFCNPLVCTFADGHGPTITTLSRALADG
jgi:hypothetical protein